MTRNFDISHPILMTAALLGFPTVQQLGWEINRFIFRGNRFLIMGENAGSLGARNLTRSYRILIIFAPFESLDCLLSDGAKKY